MVKVARTNIILAFAAIYLIWGSTYLAIRFGVETLPPFLMAGIRFLIGGSLFFVWGIMRGGVKPQLKHWGSAAFIGILLLVGGNGLVTLAEKTVPSGLTALIIGLVPMWVVLIDWLRPKGNNPSIAMILGLILGFGGVTLLINPFNVGSVSQVEITGGILLVIATLLWAIGSVYSKYVPAPSSQSLAAGMQMLVGGVVLVLLAFTTGEFNGFNADAVTLKSVASLGYLITFGSLGYAAYVWLLQHVAPTKVATYAYVNPVIALFLGNLLAGEAVSSWTIICSIIVILAVVIIITAKGRLQTKKTEIVAVKPQTAAETCLVNPNEGLAAK